MTNNPHKTAKDQSERKSTNSQFVIGRVEEIAQDQHMLGINVTGEDSDLKASALTSRIGDVSLPDIDEHVLVGYTQSGQAVSLGSLYFQQDGVPSFNPSDRRIGNSSSGSNMTVGAEGDISMTASEQSVTDSPEAAAEAEAADTTKNFTLTPDGAISISNNNGASVSVDDQGRIEATNDAASGSVVIEPDGTITVDSEQDVSVNAASVDVNSTDVRLGDPNGSAEGVARQSDPVSLMFNGESTVQDGSEDVQST